MNFRFYIDLRKKKYERPNYTVRYGGAMSHRIEVTGAKKDTCFFIEPVHNGISPIVSQSGYGNDSAWKHDVVDLMEIGRYANQRKPADNSFFASVAASLCSTAAANTAGISPNYIKVQAKTDYADLTISNGMSGEIFCLQGGKMPFLIRPGSFIMCELGIVLGIRPVEGKNSVFLTQQTGYSMFVEISGDGLCFLQGGTQLDIWELEPDEMVRCNPQMLMVMSESVHILDAVSSDSDLAARRAMGADWELLLKADERGGIVCISDQPVYPIAL